MKRTTNGLTKLYLFTIRNSLAHWLPVAPQCSLEMQEKELKMYVVRKYHGHASWIDPKHLAEYTEAEFETRHEALAHCERLKGKGIVEIYQREVIE